MKKLLSKEEALQKLRQYCAYQERSHHEVQQKLWDLGVRRADHDEVLSKLIEDDYLNEERFAKAFAGGKFRMKDWGRKKILYELRQKRVSDYCIRKGLAEIPEDDYQRTLEKLAEKKWESLKGEQYLVRQKKTQDYLVQKGYEHSLITEAVRMLRADTDKP
ncbi:MAG: RecX family transcriptional regulator [Chitinophagaceae bacterium]|nr:MAG: RecX family transcriptional regulator [Chitinophagaceae bacterium]